MTISGATRVAGVIGDPVRHSLSPVLHNAAPEKLFGGADDGEKASSKLPFGA